MLKKPFREYATLQVDSGAPSRWLLLTIKSISPPRMLSPSFVDDPMSRKCISNIINNMPSSKAMTDPVPKIAMLVPNPKYKDVSVITHQTMSVCRIASMHQPLL